MKRILILISFITSIYSSYGQFWEELKFLIPPIEYISTTSKGDIFFNSKLSDDNETLTDSFNYIWFLPANDKVPIICYKTKDTLIDIQITSNNAVLLFFGFTYRDYCNSSDNIIQKKELKKIMQSEDGGKTWTDTILEISGDFKYFEKPDGILFLTGISRCEDKVLSQIYKSTNEGKSWIKTNWPNAEITNINLLKTGLLIVNSDSTIYTSEDDGTTWIRQYEISPKNYHHFQKINDNEKWQWFSNTLHKSADSGKTWVDFSILPNDTLTDFVIFHNDNIYSLSRTKKLYRSVTDGEEWDLLADFSNSLNNSDWITSDYYYSKMIEHKNELYIRDIYNDSILSYFHYDRLKNGLNNISGDIISHNERKALWFPIVYKNGKINIIQNGSRVIILSLDEKKIISDFSLLSDLGLEYPSSNRLFLTPKNTLLLDIYNKSGQHFKYKSDNYGMTWELANNPFFNGYLFHNNKNQLMSLISNELFISDNNGLTFQKFGNPVPDSNQTGGGYAYCSRDGIYTVYNHPGCYFISEDEGKTWITIKAFESETRWFYTEKIRIDKQKNIFVKNVFNFGRTTNYGITWDKIRETGDYNCGDFELHTNGELYSRFFWDFFKSTNKGNNWEKFNNMGENFLGTVAISNNDIIFLNSHHSTNNGNTWIYNGLSGNLLYNDETILMLARIYADPIYRLYKFINQTNIEDLSKNNSEIIISPNPASDYIEISLDNHTLKGVVENIAIYDILGTKITTPSNLTPGPSPGGEGSIVRVDVSHLLPGVYFVRVGNEVRKFVKM